MGATGSAPGSRTGQAPLGADLTILPDAGSQEREHGAGVTALALARTVLPPGRVSSRWSGDEALVLAASPYRSTPELVADLQLAAARSVASRSLAPSSTRRSRRHLSFSKNTVFA